MPLMAAALVGATITAPLLIAAALAVDLVRLKLRLPTLRLAVFAYYYLLLDAWAVGMGVRLWARHGFGRRLTTPASIAEHSRVQWLWAERLIGGARRILGLRFEVDSPVAITPGPVIAVGRHCSYGDAILPIVLFGSWAGMELRYVLAAGLAWDPCLDVFGHRLRNHFVDRNPTENGAELAEIAALAAGLGHDDAAVIFPEGQFFTPARKARAVSRIATDDPALAERADRLRHVLPPRPGGVLQLVDAAPHADVVFVGHVGFEGFSRLADLWRNVPLRRPVLVRTWRVPALEVPTNAAERLDWLYRRWSALDAWVEAELARPLR